MTMSSHYIVHECNKVVIKYKSLMLHILDKFLELLPTQNVQCCHSIHDTMNEQFKTAAAQRF